MPKVFHKLVYVIILCISCRSGSSSKSSKPNICRDEKTSLSDATFEWKIGSEEDDDNYIVSQPDVCWNNDSIVLRKCNFENGEWWPTQVQCQKYQSKNRKCPDGLDELHISREYLCLKISPQKEAYDERSYYGSDFIISGNADGGRRDNEILAFLWKEYKIMSFWMPIRRLEAKEVSPYVIRLPGEQWNDVFYSNEWSPPKSRHELSSKHCLVAALKKGRDTANQITITMDIQTAACNELHYSVGVIENHFVAKSGCPQDFGALSHRPNECYGITWNGQKYPEDFRMLNVIEYFRKLNTINIIFEELDIVSDKFVQVEGAVVIPDKKWAIKPKRNELKIMSSTKKIHGLCVEYIESRKDVQMLLRIDAELDSLILTVYNKYYIWSNTKPENAIYCFTNADYELVTRVDLKKIWENDLQTKTIFKLKMKTDDPGQYWCEAHTIFNFTHVTTSKVVAAKAPTGHTFAMQIEVPSAQFPFNFAPDQMKDIATSIRKDMKNVRKDHKQLKGLIIHNVRIMEVIQQNATHLHCICHTTATIKYSPENTSEEQNSRESDDSHQLRSEKNQISAARRLLVLLMYKWQPHLAGTVLSTEFCFPEAEWHLARIGQSAVKSQLCLRSDGLPVTRRCRGDFIRGAYWEDEPAEVCTSVTQTNPLTSHLYNIEQQSVAQEQVGSTISKIRELLESNMEKLIPADLYYLASVISNSIGNIFKAEVQALDKFINGTIQQSGNFSNLSETSAELVRILNFLLEANERVVRNSAVLNSTNILLDTFEYLIDHISLLEAYSSSAYSEDTTTPSSEMQVEDAREIEVIEYLDVGVVVTIATNFLVFVISPQVANITGIALLRADPSTSQTFYEEGGLKGAFKNDIYRFISANQSADDLLLEENILMATYVPSSLWQRLDEISYLSNATWRLERQEPKIIIKVYANDKLFQEANSSTEKLFKDKIVSISIPGHDKDLPEVMPLILAISEQNIGDSGNGTESHASKRFCGYWNYKTWANDGVEMMNRSETTNNTTRALCGLTHLTPFAYLIGGRFNLSVDSDIEYVVKEIHKEALDIITLVGCSLTLFGIFGLFVTACTFRSWRKKANSKVLLQLSAAIALQMILFCFVNTEAYSEHLITNQIYDSCIAIGACLHYSVLVQFCWMIIIAYLQFKRYVQVFGNTRPTRFFIKSAIFGWGLPLVPVACVLCFDSDSYIPRQDNSSSPLCYPTGISFYTALVLPITLVITANLIIFIVVLYNLLKSPAGAMRHTEKSVALSQVRVLVLLFFLLGFTWIFGLLNIMKTALVFSYLFCLTATLQGFILFLYFVVLDPVTRYLWCGYFAKIFGLRLNKVYSSSVQDTTQSFQ